MDSFSWGGVFLEAVGAMAAAGLAAPASAQVVGLGEDYVRAVVVELVRFGDGGDAVFGKWVGRNHASIFADVAESKRLIVYCAGRAADARDWLGWAITHCWACWIWGDSGSAVFQALRN